MASRREVKSNSLSSLSLAVLLLAKSRDITEVMEDDEGGQSSGWEIVCAFAERGELPYKDEAKVSPDFLVLRYVDC